MRLFTNYATIRTLNATIKELKQELETTQQERRVAADVALQRSRVIDRMSAEIRTLREQV